MHFSNFFKQGAPKTPAPPLPEPVAVSPWLAQNQETLDELARFIDFAEGFTLGFLEINFTKDLDDVIKALRKRSECAMVQFHVFNFDDPNLRFLKDALEEKIQQLPPPVSLLLVEKRVIMVKGLENAIGLFGDYPPLLQDLNFVRDAWIESVPYPVLLCLPSYAIQRVNKFAPDFWSWQSGVFRIAASQERSDEASIYALHAQKMLGSASQLERQERIKLLEKLAQEFDPLQAHRCKADLRIAAQALTKLGIVQCFAGELLKAEEALALAAQVFSKPEWQPETKRDLTLRIKYLTWHGYLATGLGQITVAEERLQNSLLLNKGFDAGLKATAYLYLANLKANQGELEDAIALYQQSLAIKERIGDAQGKAATLHQMGRLKADQGDVEGAIALYQQSLEIFERIGDAQGKASTLHGMGRLKANQGEVEDAIALYQQSLEIFERIGDAQGKASTLHRMGILKANQGQVEDAIALYQQSLAIKERIGNAQGKAATLHCIAILKANQGDVEGAIALYQQSLAIKERIGDAQGKASTLSFLGELIAQRGEVDRGIAQLQESVTIYEKIGSPDAAGVRKVLERVQRMKQV
ncbi:tetratricopeptide repeat protein [Leptolyngbya sp. PCC 6406]|uniref:tetratricopeptide repeat protein n=1 Tax=Leptolyngbya sp. PCC 6406 TaxID=1173264 RepID=UPI0004804ED8|nr:tetratricopeptide repeat protein [Leptolyngbya sp. PCC 6406]